jgi:hypothetical protein
MRREHVTLVSQQIKAQLDVLLYQLQLLQEYQAAEDIIPISFNATASHAILPVYNITEVAYTYELATFSFAWLM